MLTEQRRRAAFLMVGGAAILASAVLHGMVSVPAAPLWVTAGAYVAFGLVAFAMVSQSVHFLGYALMGVLVAIGAVPARGR